MHLKGNPKYIEHTDDGQIINIFTDIDTILQQDDIHKIIYELETTYRIKIYLGDKKHNSESSYNGYISIYKDNIEMGEIWTSYHYLGNDDLVDGHLGIQTYGYGQGKGYGTLLYKLYKRRTELDSNIYFPIEEYASTNSRIILLTKMGYKLVSMYECGCFRVLNKSEIKNILTNAKKDFYRKAGADYRFIYKANSI